MSGATEFSFRSRAEALRKFENEVFDILVIGGGITGAAAARDAATRGLKVALVEREDFAFGTSSRSSKLIHGGLRYLQNFELGLVFEALAERALLLKTAPHLVKPLPFYLPVYEGDHNGRAILSMGLWLYDMLSLFRAPGSHRHLSRDSLLGEIPFLRKEKLKGGFRYFDASMWDDVLVVQTLRAARASGAEAANYVEALSPVWDEERKRIQGFRVKDRLSGQEINLRASRVIVCAGPWTDEVGQRLSPQWRPWLTPSKGVHLIFDQKRIPVPGAMVMSQPEEKNDNRIAFVIPRPDFGAGVVIVGTTDGPVGAPHPQGAEVNPEDVHYLMDLLQRYFPDLKLTTSDILSAYVGVRPLMGSTAGSEGQRDTTTLQKVSREHHIASGPGGTVVVAGGKYTTHRKMAEEIVEFALKTWDSAPRHSRSKTHEPINPAVLSGAVEAMRARASAEGVQIPPELVERYGAEALEIVKSAGGNSSEDPTGFPYLASQLRHAIRQEMVVHLEDFYLRRLPLFLSRTDHGLPWAEKLAQVWAEEMGAGETEASAEIDRLRAEIEKRSAWRKKQVPRG